LIQSNHQIKEVRKEMPRPRMDEHWHEPLKSYFANFPDKSPETISREMEQKAARDGGRMDIPAPSTIRRFRNECVQADLTGYRDVYWPGSFERGDLPWEAAAAVLTLYRQRQKTYGFRPSVRQARWYWHIVQSAPDIREFEAEQLASKLAHCEVLRSEITEDTARWVEAYILFRAWAAEGEAVLTEEMAAGRVPNFGTAITMDSKTSDDPEQVAQALSAGLSMPIELTRQLTGIPATNHPEEETQS
jgi:hypothetical protein